MGQCGIRLSGISFNWHHPTLCKFGGLNVTFEPYRNSDRRPRYHGSPSFVDSSPSRPTPFRSQQPPQTHHRRSRHRPLGPELLPLEILQTFATRSERDAAPVRLGGDEQSGRGARYRLTHWRRPRRHRADCGAQGTAGELQSVCHASERRLVGSGLGRVQA